MIKISGKSEIGQSHIGKGKCQDACYFRDMGNFAVLAVADGLGSSKHSDIASEMASKRSVDYCIKGFQDITARKGTSADIIPMIQKVFDQVNFEIGKHGFSFNILEQKNREDEIFAEKVCSVLDEYGIFSPEYGLIERYLDSARLELKNGKITKVRMVRAERVD